MNQSNRLATIDQSMMLLNDIVKPYRVNSIPKRFQAMESVEAKSVIISTPPYERNFLNTAAATTKIRPNSMMMTNSSGKKGKTAERKEV